MTNVKKKKILIVAKSLSEGGAERAAAVLSLMLKKNDFDVSIVILDNKISYDFYGQVTVLNNENLEKNYKTRLIFFREFRKYIKENHFDYLVDFRTRNLSVREWLINKLIYVNIKNIIFTVHLPELALYVPKPSFLFEKIYSKAQKIVVVSNEINTAIKNKYFFENTKRIYNAVDINKIQNLKDHDIIEKEDFVLIVGRMNDDIKQIERLINIYPKTNLKLNNIKLFVMGSGVLEDSMKARVKANGESENIRFLSFQENPYKYMSKAKFLILCSKIEGFPYVLLESLACGTPVVSFNCSSGPSEIIKNNFNGLLVENQNFSKLAESINEFISDQGLYEFCKKNSFESVKQFDVNIIGKEWLKVLQ